MALNKDEAIALLTGPFGRVMRDTVTKYVAPFFWKIVDDTGTVGLRNGTVFFLDTGQRVLAVTAGHVYRGYLASKDDYPESVCQLSNLAFEPEIRLIASQDESQRLPDIATFEITSEEVRKLGKMVLTGHQKVWPPPPPEEGKGVFFSGFPGQERLVTDSNEVNFGVFHGGLVATSVSDRDILCHIDDDYIVDSPWFPGTAPADYDLRGVSGAPLLTVVEHMGIWSWRLGGVIYKAPAEGQMFLAVRADYILPDGQLKPFT